MAKDWTTIAAPTPSVQTAQRKFRDASSVKSEDVDLDSQYVVVLAKVVKQAAADDFQGVKTACEQINGVLAVEAVGDILTPTEISVDGVAVPDCKFQAQVHTRLRVVGTAVEEEVPQ